MKYYKVGHYLWGIDTQCPDDRRLTQSQRRSDITYEELIRNSINLFLIERVNRRTLPMRNWYSFTWSSFLSITYLSDITYEELIRYSHSLIKFLSFLWRRTLPMRNWYIIVLWYNLSLLVCRTLPMRNWYMIQSLSELSNIPNRRTLPMRNWYILKFL